MDDSPPYGARFADAWIQLQRYLSDLDAGELERLRGLDREATLALLLQQPELRSDAGRALGPDVSPEQLAARIVGARLRELQSAAPTARTWGARFLDAWRDHGGPLSSFKYEQIQTLKSADRATAKKYLAKGLTLLSYSARKAIDELEPEEFAQRLVLEMTRYRGGHGSAAFYF